MNIVPVRRRRLIYADLSPSPFLSSEMGYENRESRTRQLKERNRRKRAFLKSTPHLDKTYQNKMFAGLWSAVRNGEGTEQLHKLSVTVV